MNCELCLRNKPLTSHHLIPRMNHSKQRFINKFGKKEMKSRQIELCEDCHTNIHAFYTEKELGLNFNTKALLLADPKIAKFVEWISKKP